jgi:CheY-like chemotaxis protein
MPTSDTETVAERRRVLVIEDNADAQLSMKYLLEMWGHEVAVAGDGPTGVDSALSLHPDITLVDIGLPEMDGYEVARRIRNAPGGEQMMLVALTGYGTPEERSRAMQAGFDVHLVKPVEPEQLCRLVAEGPGAKHAHG